MRIVASTAENMVEAAALVRAGEIVAYPTETVYGLAVDPFSVTALEKLFAVKGRAETNPVLLIVSNIDQVIQVVSTISDDARTYADRFWPGPLSMLFPKSDRIPAALCAGGPKVCVRIPAHETARALCAAVGHAITSTSANKSGKPPATSPHEIDFPGVALCIDGGTLPPSQPSTIFDPDTRTILRKGAISSESLIAF